MGMLCRRVGPSIYEDTKDVIMQGVITNLERQPMIEPSASGHVDTEKLAEKLTGGTSGSDADGSISPGTSPRRVCWSCIYYVVFGPKVQWTYGICVHCVPLAGSVRS